MLLGRAVREVYAQHVGAANEERAEYCGIARGGADRCNDLRAFLKYGFHCERCLVRRVRQAPALLQRT